MKTIKIFTSPNCPNCPPAKAMAEELKKREMNVVIFDISEAEGLAEAQMFTIMAVPTIVIVDEDDKEIASWRTGLPSIDEIIEKTK